jgi:hypothetical protein
LIDGSESDGYRHTAIAPDIGSVPKKLAKARKLAKDMISNEQKVESEKRAGR